MDTLGSFLCLSTDEVSSLESHVRIFELDSGKSLFQVGDLSRELFVLLEGTVAYHVEDAALAHVIAPAFVGGIGFLDCSKRFFSCMSPFFCSCLFNDGGSGGRVVLW